MPVTGLATVLLLILTVAIMLMGAVLALTGRQFPRTLRRWPREGWPMRVAGGIYFLVGAGLTLLTVRDGAQWDAVVIAYVGVAVSLWPLYGRGLTRRFWSI